MRMHRGVRVERWRWYGTAGHLIVGSMCQFHLCTKVGPWLVSTVGEYWPTRASREIHAEIHDPQWLAENRVLRDDSFDAAYMKQFGYEEIGCDRTFETMVFRAGAPCAAKGCGCGIPSIDGDNQDMAGYKDAGAATRGHYAMCREWAKKRAPRRVEAPRGE